MKTRLFTALALALPCVIAPGVTPHGTNTAHAHDNQRLRATYQVYAAGLDFVSAEVRMAMGTAGYTLDIRYRTTGVLGVLYPGRQHNMVSGAWHGIKANPHRYHGVGQWRGRNYVSLIDYGRDQPEIRTLLPPIDEEREPVPEGLRAGAIDTLSGLAGLIEHVARHNRCDTSARLFDGRRATEVTARTVGRETLPQTGRSSYAGDALRCDFEALTLAGFRRSDDAAYRARPHLGTAWFARAVPLGFPVPVRLTFETRALGTARMYLTGIGPDPEPRGVAADPVPVSPGSGEPADSRSRPSR